MVHVVQLEKACSNKNHIEMTLGLYYPAFFFFFYALPHNGSNGDRTGKGQFSFQSQRKAIPKNAKTTAQLHSSHTLVK